MYTFFSCGSMSQPSWAPFAMYSCIFACKVAKSSERERSSTTKSGPRGGNSSCSSAVAVAHIILMIVYYLLAEGTWYDAERYDRLPPSFPHTAFPAACPPWYTCQPSPPPRRVSRPHGAVRRGRSRGTSAQRALQLPIRRGNARGWNNTINPLRMGDVHASSLLGGW